MAIFRLASAPESQRRSKGGGGRSGGRSRPWRWRHLQRCVVALIRAMSFLATVVVMWDFPPSPPVFIKNLTRVVTEVFCVQCLSPPPPKTCLTTRRSLPNRKQFQLQLQLQLQRAQACRWAVVRSRVVCFSTKGSLRVSRGGQAGAGQRAEHHVGPAPRPQSGKDTALPDSGTALQGRACYSQAPSPRPFNLLKTR